MNIQDLKDKLRRHYFELEKEKLQSDPYYLEMLKMATLSMAYSIPAMRFENGVVSQEVPKTFELIKEQIEDYIKHRYPYLHGKADHPLTIHPYDNAFVITPERLTLDKIDARLTLFATYLKYRLNCLFDSHGWIYDSPLEYDEWLYMKGYEQLVEIIWN